jgi:hypothetical protein
MKELVEGVEGIWMAGRQETGLYGSRTQVHLELISVLWNTCFLKCKLCSELKCEVENVKTGGGLTL